MLESITVVAAVLALMALGFVHLGRALKRVGEAKARVVEFILNLRAFVESNGKDGMAYGELVQQSVQVQQDAGSLGVGSYRPAGAPYIVHGYDFIVNLPVELRRELQSAWHAEYPEHARETAQMLHEVILRHRGGLEIRRKRLMQEQRNPVVLLREGVTAVLGIPIGLLASLGLVSAGRGRAALEHRAMKFIAGVFTLVGLIGAVVTIVLGWGAFAQKIQSVLGP